MANNTVNMDQWTWDDYMGYLSHSSRLSGVAESFKDIYKMMNQLHEIEQQPISHDMAYDRARKLEEMKAAADAYVQTHKDARSTDGKRRHDMMEALSSFCDREKKVTELDADVRYFQGKSLDDVRKGVSLEEYKPMEEEIVALEAMEMNEENVIRYANALTRYVQAAESYMHAHPEKKRSDQMFKEGDFNRMAQGMEANPYEYAAAIVNKYKEPLDKMRDLREVRKLTDEGKTWEDLLALRTARHVISGPLEKQGAEASQRIKTSVNGQPGFFTREIHAGTTAEAIQRYIHDNDNEKGRLFAENHQILERFEVTSKIEGSSSHMYFVCHELCEAWRRMEPSPERDSWKEFLTKTDVTATNPNPTLRDVTEEYGKRYKEANPYHRTHPNWKKQVYAQIIEEKIGNKKLREQYQQYADKIVDSIERRLGTHSSKMDGKLVEVDFEIYKDILKQDEKTVEGRKAVASAQQLLANEEAKRDFISAHMEAAGAETTRSLGGMNEKDRAEMTGRNVLTSRMAELLNIGHLIAHSEKMTVEVNGKTMTGCFMEYAKGIQNTTEDYDQLQEFLKVDPNRLGPGLAKDACSLNLFDVICGQRDRHSSNFFQILGPEKADGTREVIGLQGIDNDQAFGRRPMDDDDGKYGMEANGMGPGLNQIKLVDDELANRIMAVTPDMVRYAVGDILTEHETDNLIQRLDRVKERIRDNKLIRLKGDAEWDLDTYKGMQDERGKQIEAAANALKHDVTKTLYPWEATKSTVARVQDNRVKAEKKLEEVKAQRTRNEADLKDYKDIMSKESPEGMMPKKKSEAEMRAKRAAIFDKIAAEKGGSTKAAPANPVRETERTSFQDMTRQDPSHAARKSISAAARQAGKEVQGLGFDEITREDIQAANSRHKKPIIGGHRKLR